MPSRIRFIACLLAIGLLWGSTSRVDAASSNEIGTWGGAPRDGGWSDYQIIMWQDQTPARLAGLARLGITAGKLFGSRDHLDLAGIPEQAAPFSALGLRWYVENIATDFYAAYHRWQPDLPVNALFDEAKRQHREQPANIASFVRNPSLSDPVWLGRIAARLKAHVQAYERYRPLYYNLADEAGIGDLAAAWDFDFAPASLAGMRAWLRGRYRTLAALNREWETQFSSWRAVLPMTTDAALRQPDGNFAAWLDFKAWMNVAFAQAVRAGTNAVHAANPRARAALEGAQIPGWGGYDYGQLAAAVDVMELYDYGNNVEIAHSLAPNLIVLKTSSLADAHQIYGVWHSLLLGGRGIVLWDEHNAFVDDDGRATARGRVLGTLAAELDGGLAAQLIASTRARDPVAILYSQSSMETQWLLDRQADGKPWAERDADAEYGDDPVRIAMRRAAGMLAHLGVAPRWLTPAMIEQGVLRTDRVRALVLPHTIALSAAAAARVRDFATHGGLVLTDTAPGQYDGHGRRLARPSLADLADAGEPLAPMPDLLQDPAPADGPSLLRLRQLLDRAGVPPLFTIAAPGGGLATNVDARVFHDGTAMIVGLQRDWASDEGNAGEEVTLDFKRPVYAYDLRKPGPPRFGARLAVTLDGDEPVLLAVTDTAMPGVTIKGPERARRGGFADFTIDRPRRAGAPNRVAHIEAIAPDGSVVQANRIIGKDRGAWRLHLAPEAPTGDWTIRLVDVLSGQRITRTLEVTVAD